MRGHTGGLAAVDDDVAAGRRTDARRFGGTFSFTASFLAPFVASLTSSFSGSEASISDAIPASSRGVSSARTTSGVSTSAMVQKNNSPYRGSEGFD